MRPIGGMHAADTNVLVRYLTNDDPRQAAKARALIDEQAVFVSRTVLLETEWVLRSVYGQPAGRIIGALRALAGLPTMVIEDAALVAKAMDRADQGLDFADALHLAAAAECENFLTFDKALIRAAAPLGGVPVATP